MSTLNAIILRSFKIDMQSLQYSGIHKRFYCKTYQNNDNYYNSLLTKNYYLLVIGQQHVVTCVTASAMNCAICFLIFSLSSSCASLCCSNTLETPCQTDNQFYSHTLLSKHITKYHYQHKLHNKTIPFKSTLVSN